MASGHTLPYLSLKENSRERANDVTFARRNEARSSCVENCPGAKADVIPVAKRSRIRGVRGATTSSCFRFGIPSGHSSGSHSTARAISKKKQIPHCVRDDNCRRENGELPTRSG